MKAISAQTESVYVSNWIRVQPDVMDNMFGALTYFPMPKSFLDKDIGLHLLIKDEQVASPHSIPLDCAGSVLKDKSGKELNAALHGILFEPGHPS